jgi:hypothetical protein
VSDAVLLSWLGWSDPVEQTDFSGIGNHGTATGATVGAYVSDLAKRSGSRGNALRPAIFKPGIGR